MTNKTEFAEYVIMIIVNLANVGLVLIKDKRVKKSEYPRGRSSEATTNLTASVVMMALAFVNFIQSFDALITGNLHPEFGVPHVVVIVVNVVVKLFLFFICLIKRENNQIRVLMRDQLTDVLTNTIALIAVWISMAFWKESDFIGASIIFFLIVRNWALIVSESWFKLQGIKGDDDVNEKVSKILSNNLNLFTVMAGYITYHIGNKAIVEIYCEIESLQRRAEIYSKFEDDEIQVVYLLPFAESKNVNLLTLKPSEEDNSKPVENETAELLKKNPLFIVAFITMSLCVTLVLIKSMFHLLRELAGPLETGPARRLTARDVNRNLEEMLPMSTRPPLRRASTLPSRPMSPIPPESPPASPFPRTHRSLHRCDIYADI